MTASNNLTTSMLPLRRHVKTVLLTLLALFIILLLKTIWDVKTPTLSLNEEQNPQHLQILDRNGNPLGISYQNHFNTTNLIPLHKVPPFLREAFITSEDQHFFEHHGVDWKARFSALWQNIQARRAVRGASTITEQVVRILHPRPRTLWSRWIEGFEGMLLEKHASKGAILEFYLNQVPYAANRHGVVQAAHYYFNRDLDTLMPKEMLALVVLPRAPSTLDLYKKPRLIEPAIARLAHKLLPPQEANQLIAEKLTVDPPPRNIHTTHFIEHIKALYELNHPLPDPLPQGRGRPLLTKERNSTNVTSLNFDRTSPLPTRKRDFNLSPLPTGERDRVRGIEDYKRNVILTTLDPELQYKAQNLLDERIKALQSRGVHNGAVLIADHTTGEILAWVVGGEGDEHTPGHDIDTVTTLRQPGSSLKPFLYALALDLGWTASTELNDAPMAESIASGLHDFHNYSHIFYGKISLREALGNSLNIPALETIDFVTPARYLNTLHALGFTSLTKPAEFYKEGLALGDGEIRLLEMVQAYSALANKGVFRPLTALMNSPLERTSTKIYSPEASSLIANILSDPFARRREFGIGSVLNLPVQTAVKTGTSSDYRDAWIFGFDSKYVVGVWMGNLDETPMKNITGAVGPALVLRGIFADLAKQETPRPLYLSPKLVQREVCSEHDELKQNCYPHTEYFMPHTAVIASRSFTAWQSSNKDSTLNIPLKIIRPTDGLKIAYDPRIPTDAQAFEFRVEGAAPDQKIEWILNGKSIGMSESGRLLWPVQPGRYILVAKKMGKETVDSQAIRFEVIGPH